MPLPSGGTWCRTECPPAGRTSPCRQWWGSPAPTPQHRLGKGDGRVAQDGGALPAEELVGPDGDGHQQVPLPGRRSGRRLPWPRTEMVCPSCRCRRGCLTWMVFRLRTRAGAPAVRAGLMDDLALAAAPGAGGGGGEDAHGGLPAAPEPGPVPWQSGQVSGEVPEGRSRCPGRRRRARSGPTLTSFSQPKAASSKLMVRDRRMLSPRWGALGLVRRPPPKPPPKKLPKMSPRSPKSKPPSNPPLKPPPAPAP